MTEVANSGPLMALAKVGSLELLRRAFRRAVVPAEVFDEVALAGADCADGALVKQAVREGWFQLHAASVLAAESCPGPGKGEFAAIRLAQTLRADAALMDDMAARRQALAHGLRVMEIGGRPPTQALETLERMQGRRDIWLRSGLIEAARRSLLLLAKAASPP